MQPSVNYPPGYRNGRLYFDASMRVLTTDFDVAAYTKRARPKINVDVGELRSSLPGPTNATGLQRLFPMYSKLTAAPARPCRGSSW